MSPPAAHVAHTRGTMSLTGAVVAGTLGSWVGAAVMYWASRLLPLIRHLIGIPAGSVHRISLWVGGLTAFLAAIYYFFVHRHMRR